MCCFDPSATCFTPCRRCAPRVNRSAASLLLDRSDLGEFAIEQPVAEIVCENGSTNLEDAIANFLKDEPSTAPLRTAISVKLTGGKIILYDAGTQSAFESVEASIAIPA